MSMRKSTARELRGLREVAHFLLPVFHCMFCKLPLLAYFKTLLFGHKDHEPIGVKFTTHHVNGKHTDNSLEPIKIKKIKGKLFITRGNTALVHDKCHRSYEMKLRHDSGVFNAENLGKCSNGCKRKAIIKLKNKLYCYKCKARLAALVGDK